MFKWLMGVVSSWLYNNVRQIFSGLQITDTKHKKERIPREVRNCVWEKYYGNKEKGRCYCCDIAVTRRNAGWHCSHVKSDTKGGTNTIDNLRVCCPGCNLSMGDQNMYAFIRNKKLSGPGCKNVESYMRNHPSERFDKRTNNWNHK